MSGRKVVSSTREYTRSARRRTVRSLSVPSKNSLWKNKETGITWRVIASSVFSIALKNTVDDDEPVMDVMNLGMFYDAFLYIGKELV